LFSKMTLMISNASACSKNPDAFLREVMIYLFLNRQKSDKMSKLIKADKSREIGLQ